MYYRMVNVCDIIEKDGIMYFIDDDIFEVEFEYDIRTEHLEILKQGVTRSDFVKFFNSEEHCDFFVDQLYKNNFIRKYRSYEEFIDKKNIKNFNMKQFNYLEEKFDSPIEAYRRLVNSTVCILGVGGVGSIILEALVGAGISNYILVDFDKVEKNNFNRQYIFDKTDVGKLKVLCAKYFVEERLDDANVVCIQEKITRQEDLEKIILNNSGISIVINAADYPHNIEDIVYNVCAKYNIACMGVGIGKNTGYWGPIKKREDLNLNFSEELPIDISSFKEESKPTDVSLGVINTIISTFAALDIILYLSGGGVEEVHSINRRVYFDCMNKSISLIKEA